MGNHGAPLPLETMPVDFVNLELLYSLIVQYGEVKAKVLAGQTEWLVMGVDNFTSIMECVKRFRRDLRKLRRRNPGSNFPLFARLDDLIKAERWNDCLPVLEDMAIHHPDGDEPLEVRVSNR